MATAAAAGSERHLRGKAPEGSATAGEVSATGFACAVADAILSAYRADGAPEDTEASVEIGELGMFGVFVAARPKSVASFRMKEIAQEAKELFERRLAEEMDAFEERLPVRVTVGRDGHEGVAPIG